MGNVEQDLKKFKLQLGPEWQKLHTAKWRRPKWIKFPRSMLEDPRWLRLSPQAAKAWMHILVIASEAENLELPAPDLLLIRLRSLGNLYHISSASSLIHELIQCGFLLKTSPELQSFRVPEIQIRKDKKQSPAREASQGFASPAREVTKEKRSGEEERVENHHHLGQPKQPIPIPKVDYAAALSSFRRVNKTPQASRRCSAFLTMTDYLAGLAPELARTNNRSAATG